jgi:hypothetical protein
LTFGCAAARRHLSNVRQRGDERRSAGELGHHRQVKLLRDIAGRPHLLDANLVVVFDELLHAADGRVDMRQPQCRRTARSALQVVEHAAWFVFGSHKPPTPHAATHGVRPLSVSTRLRGASDSVLRKLSRSAAVILDVPDAGARPSLERGRYPAAAGRVLMNGERHSASGRCVPRPSLPAASRALHVWTACARSGLSLFEPRQLQLAPDGFCVSVSEVAAIANSY